MTEKGNIEKIFSEGFQDFQADVDASVWNGIESNLQPPVSSPIQPVAGVSTVAKAIIGLTTAAIITSGVFYFTNSKNESSSAPDSLTNQVILTPQQPKESLPVLSNQTEQTNKENKTQQKEPSTVTGQSQNKDPLKTEQQQFGEPTVKEVDESGIPPVKTNETPDNLIQEQAGKLMEQTEVTPQNNDKEKSEITESEPGSNPSSKTSSTPSYKPFPLQYNVITPNADGHNDYYSFDIPGVNIISIEALIVDSNNKLVNKVTTAAGYWDGKDLKGNVLPNGTYRIVVSATDDTGINYKGQISVTLNK